MAQENWVDLDPAVDDGSTLSVKLNRSMAALYSTHAGAAPPPAPVEGQQWIDTSGAALSPPLHVLKQYAAGGWRPVYETDLSTGAVTFPSAAQAVAAFDPTDPYPANALVVYGGDIYRANGAVAAGAWNPGQWTRVTQTEAALRGLFVAKAGDTMRGSLTIEGVSASVAGIDYGYALHLRSSWEPCYLQPWHHPGIMSGLSLVVGQTAGQVWNFRQDGQLHCPGHVSAPSLGVSDNIGAGGAVFAAGQVHTPHAQLGYAPGHGVRVGTQTSAFGGNATVIAQGSVDGVNALFYGLHVPNVVLCARMQMGDSYIQQDSGGQAVGTGGFAGVSDQRVKKDIAVIPGALDKVAALRGVTYKRTDMGDRPMAGLIAQEVQAVLPEAVTPLGDLLAMDTTAVVGLLVEAVKELRAEVVRLKSTTP
jgi:hypothetical protein